ncbi:MAG: hypothetical protein FWG56_04225 [Desulfovibrionaceae bacterium]|nr:hypothetical protein [Desulfovibrionaceae bacterium]
MIRRPLRLEAGAQAPVGRVRFHEHWAAQAALCAGIALGALGCASDASTARGAVQGQAFDSTELIQSEGNRVTQLVMLSNRRSLLLLADKLYRRNPVEWRKNAASREAALSQLESAMLSGQAWAPLDGRRDVAALSLSLAPEFTGDRVAAFVIACNDTIVTAHGGKRDFYYLDGVDPQYIYNAARNMETALWILNTRKDAQGQPLLLSNEIGPDNRNLSFEREFGKIIGRLDLLASYMTERYRRAVIGFVQGLVMAPALVFLPVK